MHRFLSLAILIISISNCFGRSVSFSIPFNYDDYSIISNEQGEINIISTLPRTFYSDKDSLALPTLIKSYAINSNEILSSYSISFHKQIVCSNINIAKIDTDLNSRNHNDSIFSFIGSNKLSKINLLHFTATPFYYDRIQKDLYFIDSIKIDMDLIDNEVPDDIPYLENELQIGKSLVINPQFIDKLESIQPRLGILSPKIDYVIITSEELAQSFEPLRIWKQTKGLHSKIVTIEWIDENISGETIQLKIKNCLQNMWYNNGLQYVLLGGDDTIIPVKRYPCIVSTLKTFMDLDIPTDIYYACFNGTYEWYQDSKQAFEHQDDNIDFTQHVYLSRVPIRNSEEVEAYITKLINYETKPIFNNSMLLVGVDTEPIGYNNENSTQSPAEIEGDLLYTQSINPYWDGSLIRFFDTATDFAGNKNFDVTRDNLTTALVGPFSFINVHTHGKQNYWIMETGAPYTSANASRQINPGHSIITTTACLTNAFDTREDPDFTHDPCLSESLIRNPNSGVIAYLGCSTYGWDSSSILGTGISFKYNSLFYQNLFSQTIRNKNFGSIVAATKMAMAPISQNGSRARMIQLGLNPIGDPETPIFISIPKKFTSDTIASYADKTIIKTGIDSCRISVMSLYDCGESYFQVFNNVNDITLPQLPTTCSLCITKQGYIPKLYIGNSSWEEISYSNLVNYTNEDNTTEFLNDVHDSQNKILKITPNPATDIANISLMLDDIVNNYSIVISSLNSEIVYSDVFDAVNKNIDVDLSTLKNGIYLVSLLIDDRPIHTCRLIKK